MKAISLSFSILLLLYMLWPMPSSITMFPQLPNSYKSQHAGDTVQVPNTVAYYSGNFRDFVIPFYKNFYGSAFRLPFIPIELNYPPEFAYTAIKDQTPSTYLEEFVYPLKGSLFVNGFEPFDKEGNPRFDGAVKYKENGREYDTKVTLRLYPSNLFARVVTWIGIMLSSWLLYKTTRRVFGNA